MSKGLKDVSISQNKRIVFSLSEAILTLIPLFKSAHKQIGLPTRVERVFAIVRRFVESSKMFSFSTNLFGVSLESGL